MDVQSFLTLGLGPKTLFGCNLQCS